MKRYIAMLTCCTFFASLLPANVWARKLPPANFGDMYSMASKGDLGALLAASHRGLDLDAVNKDGDAGVCVAVKRGDFMAYNTFIKAGAMPHPPCVNLISKSKYDSFMSSSNAIKYSEYPTSFVPRESSDWGIVGAVVLGVAGMFWVVTNSGK